MTLAPDRNDAAMRAPQGVNGFVGALLAAACLLAVACSSGSKGEGEGGAGGSTSGGGTTGAAGAAVAGSGGSVGPGGAGPGGAAVAGSTGTAGAVAGSGGSAGGSSGVAGAAVAGSGGSARGGSNGVAGSGMAGAAAGRGGSGVAGSAGSPAGGAGGGASTPVTPTKSGNIYKFTFGDVVFEIDQQVGGRVSKLALGGADLVMTSATDPTTWGSVFWTSPRADWTPTTNDWPPPTAIDNAPYTGDISGTHVVVSGPTDSSLGVFMKKDYAASTSGWININYTINATKALKAAPWEVSRVPRGGIVFFPVGASLTKGPLNVTQSASGVAWFDDAPMTATSPNGDKCYADGMGWLAYVRNGNLFLKKFVDQPATAQPAGEGEIDVYPGAGFLEFEVQGPYTQIAANGNLPWSIQWKVVKVPSSVTVAVGSASLVDFAKQQLGL